MIKDFLDNLLNTIIALILIAILFAPAVIPCLLVFLGNASPLWFLLCILYIPYVAAIITYTERNS